MAEKEYIGRGALLEILNGLYDHHLKMRNYAADGATQDCITAVVEAHAADVVEVVRCKDCIYYKANSCFNRQWDFESSTEIPLVRENDFCSYGERKVQK